MDINIANIAKKLDALLDRPPKAAQRENRSEEPARAPAAETAAKVEREILEKAARDIELNFEVKVTLKQDEGTGRNIVQIFDQEGERLIRQIPAEAALKILDRLRSGHGDALFTSLV